MTRPHLTEATRARLYELGIAAVLVFAAYHLVDGEQADAWIGLVAAALGIARANVRD